MNIAVLGAVIGVISALFGMLIGYFTFVRKRDEDLKTDAADDAVIRTKLDAIGKGVDDIRIEMKANDKQMSRMNEQLIRVDESAKSAHKRLDKIERNDFNG